MNDIMVDLETMGTGSNAAIVQIGAIRFDRTTGGISADVFKVNVDLQDCIEHGLKVNGDTVAWWMSKSDIQREGLYTPNPIGLYPALCQLTAWLAASGPVLKLSLWSRSPRFDLQILEDAYKASSLKIPWDFRQEMCVRTIETLRPDIKQKHDLEDANAYSHDALKDCLHQIWYVSDIWKELNL